MIQGNLDITPLECILWNKDTCIEIFLKMFLWFNWTLEGNLFYI